ncbi:MAG: DUF1598 domain-containing protein [Planctomycetaceae bacterium]|nr:DUF1598 domain-containing protein [Planctomycetaceae bacterium]
MGSHSVFGQAGFQPVAGGVAVQGGAQGGVQGNVQGGVQGGAQGNVQGNVQGGGAGGIQIDAQGVVTPKFSKLKSGQLNQAVLDAFAKKFINEDVNVTSPLRKVSLVRLEAAIEECLNTKKPVPPEMQFLAGIQRIDYVFLDPESKDLVIAGPAEGFAMDDLGRVVGVSNRRPPLRLDDLMVALRALQKQGALGCSIDAEDSRMTKFQQYVKANSTRTTPAGVVQRYKNMATILGMQNISVWGVPADSHFGYTLVEADWRMKRLSLDLENPQVRDFRSHLAMVGRGGNATQRFWFMPLYDAFEQNEGGTAFHFAGQRAQLMSQEEYVSESGKRFDAPTTRVSTQRFAKHFTDKFPELAESMPVFAELQNTIDLAILAALFKKERLPQKIGWRMSLFLDSERATYATTNAPKQVASVVNYRKAGRGMVVGLIGGGVVINAMDTIRAIEFKTDEAERVEGIRAGAFEKPHPEQHPWWWD